VRLRTHGDMDASQQGCAGRGGVPAAKCRSGPGGRNNSAQPGTGNGRTGTPRPGASPAPLTPWRRPRRPRTAATPKRISPHSEANAGRSGRARMPPCPRPTRSTGSLRRPRASGQLRCRRPGTRGPRRARRSHARPRHTGGLLLRGPGRRICAMAV